MYGPRKGTLSGSASSILERARGQLQGKRYGVMTRSAGSLNRSRPAENTEDDDLNAYLSQISKKTAKNTEKIHKDDDDDDDVNDISISSDEDFGVTNSTLNASRFLKKSQSQTLTTDTAKEAGKSSVSRPIRKSATTPNFLNKTAPAFTSSALQKAAQLGAKFAKKKAAIAKRQDSDSDDELRFNKDISADNYSKDIVQQDNLEEDGNKFLKKTLKKTFYVSESDDSSNKTDPEDNFGRDGNRFLKKSTQPHQDIADPPKKEFSSESSDGALDVSVDVVPASRFLKKKAPGTTAVDRFTTSTPKKEFFQTQSKQNDGLSRAAPAVSSNHLGMSLDSDEEDLKDFIDNLTPTSTPEVPPVREIEDHYDQHQVQGKDESAKSYKRSMTPGPGKRSPSVTSSETLHDSVAEDIGSNVSESIDEDIGGLTANIMQIEDLEPARSVQQVKHQQDPKTKAKKDTVKEAWSESDVNKSESTLSEKDDDDHPTLNLAGLQTVDNLLLHHESDKSSEGENRHGGYGSDFETATEIATQRTEDVPEESIHSVIQSGRKAEEETHSSVHSVTRSVSESSSRTTTDSYTSYSKSDSYSESSRSYSRSFYSRSRTRSGKRSSSEQTQTYSEDFQSSTNDGTDTELEDLPSDDKSTATITQSNSYTSYSETTTVKSVTPRKRREGMPRREGMKDVAIQADGTEGLLHHWITDSDIAGIGSMTHKDPTPVTTHVINPEALEALTNFSPSLLALNDSLLTQLQHTRESIHNSLRLHRSLVDGIENDYEYTTLENTKEFIAQHRRPKLTMEQALLMVKHEMDEEDRL